MNNEYQNQIKKDIEAQMPFISELYDTQVVVEEYLDSKFYESLQNLVKDQSEGGRGYKHIRRLRRDGNCFYRAFLFQLFEHYAIGLEKDDQAIKTKYDALVAKIESSKGDMVKDGGYDEIVIEDFYDVFLTNLKKLAELKDEFTSAQVDMDYAKYVETHLIKVLCNHEEANYIIMYMRFLAATYLKQNAILYEDFLGEPIAQFCVREVEQVDVECDHPQIIAITNYLGQGVEINGVSAAGDRIDITKIPEDDFADNKFRVRVLFVPGHYDALYE